MCDWQQPITDSFWMPCVQNKNIVSVPGIDLLSGKEHPGSFGRQTQHNNQPIYDDFIDEEEEFIDEEEASMI